jgi:GDP-4-dehydro-6-deoxy-D-mannose reductase
MLRAQAAVPIDVEVDPARLRPVDLPVLVGDHGRLTATTGWTPQIPLADTITALLEEQRALIPRP